MQTPTPPKSDTEFQAAMESIDEQMRREGVPIHGRSLRAGLEYSKRYGLSLKFALSGQVGTPGNYSDQNAEAHIRDWIDLRYGERQHISFGPGTVVVLLCGDPWPLRLPLIYGAAHLVVDRDLDRYSNEPAVSRDAPLSINILTLIERLPKGLAAHLSELECRELLMTFRATLQSMSAIERLKGKPFALEIQADIAAAVGHIFAVPPHFGQSRWSSCQAAEKAMKCLLKVHGVAFPRGRDGHDLEKLAILANGEGVKINAADIALASASASTRYGEVPTKLEEAVAAHYASLAIGQQVSGALMRT